MATTSESSITDARRGAPQVTTTVDPVCGMQVVGAEESLTIDYKGHQFQFCSIVCRDTFRTEPEKFA